DANYDEALLEHWHQAGDLDKEIYYLNPVARHLVEIAADYERARVLLERGLQTLPAMDAREVALRNWLATSHERQGQYDQAQTQAQAAHQLATQFTDRFGLATSLHNLGNIALRQGDYPQAQDYYQQSLSIKRAIGDQYGIANSLNNLGNVMYYQGNYSQAQDYYQQSLSIGRDSGEWGIASSLNNLGNIAYNQGDYGQAQDYYQQSLSIYRDIGNQAGIAVSLNNLGRIAYHQGDYGQAWDYYQQSLSIKRDIGNQQGIAVSLNNLGFVYLRIQSDLTRATFHEALTIAHSIQTIPLLLMSLLGFAWLYLQGTQPARAGELCGLAQHHPAFNSEVQHWLDDLVPQLEEALSPAELKVALERGKVLDLDTVVAELLEGFAEDNT
ncbi:MAG: tetratricopeptide repeat protein, partial [bacterium]|nr:tetratricopeptide repeat protein [bacterium]